MDILYKDPNEQLDYRVDWSVKLGSDTISGVTWEGVDGDLTQVDASNDSTSATVWIGGGLAGSQYGVICEVVTAAGRTLRHPFMIAVQAAPAEDAEANLWLTLAEADSYMATRLGAADHWGVATHKLAALTTAQADIEASGRYLFEDAAGNDLTETPTTTMQQAVCEQALFLLANPDQEQRLALQAQGVTQADIVGETYDGGGRRPLLAPRAVALLAPYQDPSSGSFAVVR